MKILIFLLAIASTYFSLAFKGFSPKKESVYSGDFLNDLQNLANNPMLNVEEMFRKEAPTMNPQVVNKVIQALRCANQFQVDHKDVLTVIDYSLPSNEKRIWVFDLYKKKLLYHTYVSHGITSGAKITNNFSNKNNSKASSLGVYKTDEIYQGRDGLSLRLTGLERGFNDNANARYVVMHGGWYVNENFIKKYGRAGRSWGCPALPLNLTSEILNTIKDKSFLVVYYPADQWFAKSKFLNCSNFSAIHPESNTLPEMKPVEAETRESILFADLNKNGRHEENEPVLTLSTDDYVKYLKKPVPVERMLRRQINNQEYVVLTAQELKDFTNVNESQNQIEQAALSNPKLADSTPVIAENLPSLQHDSIFKSLNFVIPVIKTSRGYYKTEMLLVPYGRIKKIQANNNQFNEGDLSIIYDNKTVSLKTTREFIRWLGL